MNVDNKGTEKEQPIFAKDLHDGMLLEGWYKVKHSYLRRARPAVGIFSLALTIRIIYNLVVAYGYYPLHDSLTYQSIAYNLLREHCYCLLPHLATVDRAPLWPGIIALVYGTLGPHDRTVRILLSFVGAATCTLLFYFAKDLFGKRCGIFAGLLAALYPFLYVYDGWLYSESLYTFLLLAFCYTLYRAQYKPGTTLLALNGLLIGLLSFTRPNGIAILGLFWLWALFMRRRDVCKSILIVSLVSLALLVPWTLRNYRVTQAFVPIAVGDGKVLLGAYNLMILQLPYYRGIWIIPNDSNPTIAQQFPKDCAGACEVRRDSTYRDYALRWMQQNQDRMPYLLALHAINMWQITTQDHDLAINRFPNRPASQFVVVMMILITPIVFTLAALGLVVTRKRWRDLLFIYFLIASTLVQCIILYGIPRFRAPIEPMLILLSAGAVQWITIQVGKHHSEKSKEAITAEMLIKQRSAKSLQPGAQGAATSCYDET